jgi:hypothetical protein
LRQLSLLPSNRDRIQRRAELAAELGLEGESLQLREVLANGRSEREAILTGYLVQNLVPFAVRLANELISDGPLNPATSRLLAERLSASVEGPAVAARVWPALLRENVWDADGWTLFGEALHRLGQATAAEMADGFGAALTASEATAPSVPLRPIEPSLELSPVAESTESLLPITTASMPRLYATLKPALADLGAPGVEPFLDPYGGAYAYLLSSTQLVLGAGALGCFGASEMIYLIALALALGPRGVNLRGVDSVSGFEDAAGIAFEADPCSLAAARVLTILDPSVRGSDPKLIDRPAVLRSSLAFQKIAFQALEMISE